jgi:hypothetical protein
MKISTNLLFLEKTVGLVNLFHLCCLLHLVMVYYGYYPPFLEMAGLLLIEKVIRFEAFISWIGFFGVLLLILTVKYSFPKTKR